MIVPILTAVADAAWEADLTGGLSQADHGVVVVRRCVDLADLLAASAAGLARAVILSGDLRRLDREALSRLGTAGLAVVGLVAPGDDAGQQKLRRLGVSQVLARDVPADQLAGAVHAAIGELMSGPAGDAAHDWSDPVPVPADAPADAIRIEPPVAAPGSGKVVAVWGPAGAPGRSTIAVNLAAELAALGHPALLVDADSYGGVIAQLIGMLDEAPGLAAACRLANSGSLDAQRLADLAVPVRPGLRLLSGITRADRWLELRPAGIRTVLDLARSLAAVTVVDCGFCLEQDEELAYDTAAPRRNGATLAGLEAADLVLAVAAADPVGLARFVRAVPDCAQASPAGVTVTVVNRLRAKVAGPGDARRQVTRALSRYAGITDVRVVPEDRVSLDLAMAAGRTLTEAAPKSPARLAIRHLATTVVASRDRASAAGRGRAPGGRPT